MSREILFRGKRIDNGEWVEGDLLHSYFKKDDTCICCPDWTNIKRVDLATVGQYTGLTDKHGSKIFEGDVVQIYNIYEDIIQNNGVVIWVNHDQAFVVCKGNNECHHYGDLGNFTNGQLLEVIGNIHDTEGTKCPEDT